MNGNKASIDEIVDRLNSNVKADVEIVCAPPQCYLGYVKSKLSSDVFVAAQNCYKVEKGAFTGEISPAMLQGWCVECPKVRGKGIEKWKVKVKVR